MCGGDKDRVTGVSSLTNEEPLVVVKVRIDIVWEVVRENCGDSRGSVVRKGEAPLCRGGCGSSVEGLSSTEDGDVSRDRGSGGHWGSEVFVSRGGDEHVVGINSDVFVKWGEEKGVEDFLSDSGGSGRHCWRERLG